jgi:hypothetical protein
VAIIQMMTLMRASQSRASIAHAIFINISPSGTENYFLVGRAAARAVADHRVAERWDDPMALTTIESRGESEQRPDGGLAPLASLVTNRWRRILTVDPLPEDQCVVISAEGVCNIRSRR